MSFGVSVLERPIVRYNRRRDRLLALVSRKQRRKLRMMQRMADYSAIDVQREVNKTVSDMILYGGRLP